MFSNMPEWHPNFLKRMCLRRFDNSICFFYCYFEGPNIPPLRFTSLKAIKTSAAVARLAFRRMLKDCCKLDHVKKFPLDYYILQK